MTTTLMATTPLLRKDLQHAGKLLCAKQASVDKAWQLHIYDTLLAAEFKPHKKTSNSAKLALEHAKQTTNFGYMHGTCADKRTWILSVSAPYALQMQAKKAKQAQLIKLNSNLKHYCREVGAMFAPDGLRQPILLNIDKTHTDTTEKTNRGGGDQLQVANPNKSRAAALVCFTCG